MNLLAHRATEDPCPACARRMEWSLEYCERECLKIMAVRGSTEYTDGTRMSTPMQPHLHATCRVCGYEFVAKTAGNPEAWEAGYRT